MFDWLLLAVARCQQMLERMRSSWHAWYFCAVLCHACCPCVFTPFSKKPACDLQTSQSLYSRLC